MDLKIGICKNKIFLLQVLFYMTLTCSAEYTRISKCYVALVLVVYQQVSLTQGMGYKSIDRLKLIPKLTENPAPPFTPNLHQGKKILSAKSCWILIKLSGCISGSQNSYLKIYF